jgi:hypothetical protein
MSSGTRALDIPPGDANYEAIGTPFVFEADSHILRLLPRTNERGKDYKYTLVRPDGTSTVLLSVPKFSDIWQPSYILKTPVAAPKGSRIETIAHYDKFGRQLTEPRPDAAREVRAGNHERLLRLHGRRPEPVEDRHAGRRAALTLDRLIT